MDLSLDIQVHVYVQKKLKKIHKLWVYIILAIVVQFFSWVKVLQSSKGKKNSYV